MPDVVMTKIEAMQKRMQSNAGARKRAIDANYKRTAAATPPPTEETPVAETPAQTEPVKS